MVSWGLKDLCTDADVAAAKLETARDFHIDLFNKDVQIFLKNHLGNEKPGPPLHFLE